MGCPNLSIVVRLLIVACLALIAACAQEPQPPPAPSAEEGLQELASMYRYLEYSKLPAPRKVEDLNDYVDSLPSALDRIKSGDFIIAWGVGRSTAPGSSSSILAYEKKAPAEGGAVLLRDGTVKTLTAEEFATAPKAK
jgi:hypothetical protein